LPLIFEGVNFVLYADDTNIPAVDKEEEALQHKIAFVIQQLEIWFCKNDLILNIKKKVHYHLIPTKKTHSCRPHVMVNRNEITYSSEFKFLGLFIRENLAWHVQIHYVQV
jgi:hypothetical protein